MPLTFDHLTSTHQLSREDMDTILAKAAEMEAVLAQGGNDLLKGKILASLFYEPSTRTRLSFEAAMQRLGGSVISAEGIQFSSLFKGESIEDTIIMAGQYADIVVMRHPEAGSADKAASVSPVPFINAGDGAAQHPTQALLDLYTIQKEMGRLENLHVSLACDPKHSRTIRSLAFLLSMYEGNRFTFISPESLKASDDLLETLKERGCSYEETVDFSAALSTDILYMNRLQEERFEDHDEFERLRKEYILTADFLQGSDVLIMDPLPRVDEIDVSVDPLPQAAYFRQVKNGLIMRMALLALLLKT